jgi:hypothetical protein
MRKLNFAAAAIAACLASTTSGYALSLQDKLTAWTDASADERLTIARALSVVASQGLPQLDEDFFASCIDFASTQTSLRSKKIGEIGSMCVAMRLRISGQLLQP